MEFFKRLRAKRRNVYENLFGAKALCVAGLIIMSAFLFTPTFFRVFQFLFFWFLAWLCGKKNNPLITIAIIFFIVAFNLVMPHGEVLFSIGAFRITSGALSLGIHRAATLAGLIMLSRVSIRQDLKIPGLFGELIGESFRLFSAIMNRKQRITRKNLIADIDQMMIDLSSDSGEASRHGTASRTKPAGFAILGAAVFLAWLPWILRFWFAMVQS